MIGIPLLDKLLLAVFAREHNVSPCDEGYSAHDFNVSLQASDWLDYWVYAITAYTVGMAAFIASGTQVIGQPMTCWLSAEVTGESASADMMRVERGRERERTCLQCGAATPRTYASSHPTTTSQRHIEISPSEYGRNGQSTLRIGFTR